MNIEQQQGAIREGLAKIDFCVAYCADHAPRCREQDTCPALRGWKPSDEWSFISADMSLAFLTEKGAVLRSHWADCKAPPSGKAFTAVIDGIGYIADCGCPNTVPLIEKKRQTQLRDI